MAVDWPGYFSVACCKRRRGLIGGVLVCTVCDFDHAKGTVLPNERAAQDVPDGKWYYYPEEYR